MLAQLTINLIDRDGIVTVAPVTLEVENSVGKGSVSPSLAMRTDSKTYARYR